MKRLSLLGLIAAAFLGGVGIVNAQESASFTRLSLERDSVYEQYLHFQASPDTAITPARVLRWINSLMGNTPTRSASNFEFQPVLRANNHQHQLIAQFAYKF